MQKYICGVGENQERIRKNRSESLGIGNGFKLYPVAVETIESFLAKKTLDHIWGELERCNKARTT